jgi:hypothetical protein
VTEREGVETLIKQLEAGTITPAEAILLLGRLGPDGRAVLAALKRMGFPKRPKSYGSSSTGSWSLPSASTGNF